jgi:hypothetical protein
MYQHQKRPEIFDSQITIGIRDRFWVFDRIVGIRHQPAAWIDKTCKCKNSCNEEVEQYGQNKA